MDKLEDTIDIAREHGLDIDEKTWYVKPLVSPEEYKKNPEKYVVPTVSRAMEEKYGLRESVGKSIEISNKPFARA